MSAPWMLVDNLLSIAQYPNVDLTGNEELTGFEAFHVADGRRSGASFWSSITTNADAYLTWTDGRLRGADSIALDRGHNLAGFEVKLQVSNDNTTWQTIFDITLPSVTNTAPLDTTVGVRTEEGAWVKRFPLAVGAYWRFYIPAMGAGLVPNVVGLWVGKGYYPDSSDPQPWDFNLPLSADGASLVGQEQASEFGWLGRGMQGQRREGTIPLRLTSIWQEDAARYHLIEQYGYGRTMWVAFSDAQANRAFQVIRPQPAMGFSRSPNLYWPMVELPYVEHEELLA